MLSIQLTDSKHKSDLSIDCQNGLIGITVVHEGSRLDFDMTFKEWDLTTNFLKDQLKIEKEKEHDMFKRTLK